MIATPEEKARAEAAEIAADRLWPRTWREQWNAAYQAALCRQPQPAAPPANMEQAA